MEEANQFFHQQPHWSLSFIHREGNRDAHHLANFSLNMSDETVWIEDLPNVTIHGIVLDEIYNQ